MQFPRFWVYLSIVSIIILTTARETKGMYYDMILRVWHVDQVDIFLLSASVGMMAASRLKDSLSEKRAMERLENSIIQKSTKMRMKAIYKLALGNRGGQFENFQADHESAQFSATSTISSSSGSGSGSSSGSCSGSGRGGSSVIKNTNKHDKEESIKMTTIPSSSSSSSSDAIKNEHEYDYEYEYEIDKELDTMPLLPITSEDTIQACRNMDITSPFQQDIFICSYPKSGTTWTQNIVVRLLWDIAKKKKNTKSKKKEPKNKEEEGSETEVYEDLPADWHLSHSAPFYEVDQYWRRSHHSPAKNNNDGRNDDTIKRTRFERSPVKTPIVCQDKQQEFRVFNTHLRPTQLPAGAKCIYIIRHPLDVMISFYHHLSNQSIEDGGYTGGSFEEFCTEFMNGTILYGKWQDHIETWLGSSNNSDNEGEGEKKKKKKNFLLLHYEDMKENLERETTRVATFLLETVENENENDKIDENEIHELVSRVVPHCTFSAMKKEKQKYTPLTVSWKKNPHTGILYNEFVRKGKVGEGRRECPTELQQRWFHCDTKIAWARWKKAQISSELCHRYLS